jgi:hypothetical protein
MKRAILIFALPAAAWLSAAAPAAAADVGWYFGGGPYLHRLEHEVAAAVGTVSDFDGFRLMGAVRFGG